MDYRATNVIRRLWATCKNEGERVYCEAFVSHALDLLPTDYMDKVIDALPGRMSERAREKQDPDVPGLAWAGADEFMRVLSRQVPEGVASGLLRNKTLDTKVTALEDTQLGVVFESVCCGSALDCFKHDKEELLLNALTDVAAHSSALMICKTSGEKEVPQVAVQIRDTVRSTLKPLVDKAVDDVARHWGQYTS